MQLAEAGQDRLGAERRAGPNGPGARSGPASGKHLKIADRSAGGLKQGEDLALGVEGIERLCLAAAPLPAALVAGKDEGQRRVLGFGEIAAADLEQPHRRRAAVDVPPRRRHEAGQQRGAHDLHVFADRIGNPPGAATKDSRLRLRNEAPGHRLVEPASGGRAPDLPFDQLGPRRRRPRHCRGTRERRRGNMIVADDPRDFLDEVGGAVDVAPPGRHRRRVAFDFETQAVEDCTLAIFRDLDRSQRSRPAKVEADAAAFCRGLAGANLRRRLAAADVEDQAAQDRQPLVEEGRIDPALEAAPRVAGQRQRLSGAGDPVGGEIGDLEHDVGGAFADPRILAAHDPANVVHAENHPRSPS